MPLSSASNAPPRSIDTLPGPKSWPLIGNMLQITPSRMHQDIEAWGRKYGSIFKFKLGQTNVVALTDHETINHVLRERPELFERDPIPAIRAREVGFGSGLFLAEGEKWVQQRRMMMAGFTAKHIRSYYPALLKVALRLQGRWQQAADQQSTIHLQADLTRYTVDVISTLALGIDMNTLEAKGDVIQQHLDRFFPIWYRRILAPIPYWRFFKLPIDREFDVSIKAINESITGFIAQARSHMKAHPELRQNPTNLLEALINSADEEASNSTSLSAGDVRDNILTLLLGGEDTTASTLAWMIYLLGAHPEVLRQAREELLRVVGDDVSQFTLEGMQNLPYLDACSLETMRIKPVAPFLVFTPTQDTVLQNVTIPKGTKLWCAFRFDSQEEKHFPNPDIFDPTRWLQTDEAGDISLTANLNSTKRISMPFGAGPRICPGRYLALLEIKFVIATLLTQFDILSVQSPDGNAPEEHMAFTMAPSRLDMRLKRR